MKFNNKIFASLICLIVIILVWPKDNSAAVYKTAKGAKIVLIHEPSPFVAVNIFIKGLKQREAKKGLANLSLALLKSGTANKTKLQIAHDLEKLGAELNCSVANDYALISGFVLKENLEEFSELLQELLLTANNPRREFERKKAELAMQLKQQEEDPLAYAIQLNRQRNYLDHYYGYSALGDPKSLAAITYADLVSFNLREIPAADILVVINGDFNKRKIKNSFSDFLSVFKAQSAAPSASALAAYPSGVELVKHGYDLTTMLYNLRFPQAESGLRQRPVHNLVDSYLGDGLTSPLFKTFREERGISYAVGSFYDFNKEAELLTIYLQTREKNYPPLLELLAETSSFKKLPAVEEYKRVKNYHLTSYYQGQQSLQQRGRTSGYQVLNGLALNYNYAKEIKKISYPLFIKTLQSLATVNALVLQ